MPSNAFTMKDINTFKMSDASRSSKEIPGKVCALELQRPLPFVQQNIQKGMGMALKAAQAALNQGEIPIGAALMMGDRCIATSHNSVETHHSVMDHAELNVLKKSSTILSSKYLFGCDLYVTLEPCPMCAYAIGHSKIRRLFFGAYNPKSGAIDHTIRLFQNMPFLYPTQTIGGVNEEECAHLLKTFFQNLSRPNLGKNKLLPNMLCPQ
jgi:tRNA(adenine34) deaminase